MSIASEKRLQELEQKVAAQQAQIDALTAQVKALKEQKGKTRG